MAMYGSVINRLVENGPADVPVVGMGGTVYYWSDRSAFTVTEIVSPVLIKVRGDIPVYAPGTGMGGYPSSYRPGDGPDGYVRLTPTGWRTGAAFTKTGKLRKMRAKAGDPVRLGTRDAYRDPHF